MSRAFKNHWPEYLIEAFCLGVFMISACLFTALLEHPSSPLHHAVASGFMRRGMIGLAMGLTAIGLIYSPWGKRSGAHMNPSVTWAFWRLGKIQTVDAVFYTVFQFLGGWLGVMISALLIRGWIADPAVAYAVTLPGPHGAGVAWGAEFMISFLLMAVVIMTSANPGWMRWTGVVAGSLVALYILWEAPLSGMSMNPARTLGSALPAGVFHDLWIYFTAPPLGMLAAAQVGSGLARRNLGEGGCAKLIHDPHMTCIFCGHKGEPV